MPAFTPGPWKHELIHGAIDIFPASNTDSDIATVYDLSEEGEANARLIAKAPVMYELLNKAFHILGKNAANDAICREIDECLSRVDGAPVQSEKGE